MEQPKINYENYPLGQVIAVPLVILILSWTCVVLRLYVKLRIVCAFSIDDSLIFISVILFTISNAILYESAVLGFGQIDIKVPETDVLKSLEYLFIQENLYLLTTITVKLSVAFLFLKLVVTRGQRIFVIATAAFYTVTSIVYIFLAIFQCYPVQYFWIRDLNNNDGECVDPALFLILVYIQTSIATATDFAFALLPFAMLWKMRMNKRTKFSVGAVLSLGIFSASVNIVRFQFVSILSATDNITYLIFPMITWTFVEVGVGIIAASLATFRPLLRLLLTGFDSIRSSRNRSSTTTRYGAQTDTNVAFADMAKEMCSLRPDLQMQSLPNPDTRGMAYFEDLEMSKGAIDAAEGPETPGEEHKLVEGGPLAAAFIPISAPAASGKESP